MINFLKQAFWTSLNSNISSIISFLSIAVLARFISPDTFGVYIFCLASKEIITSICAPSLSQTYLFSNGTFRDFKKNIAQDKEIMELIDEDDLKQCFDPCFHLNNLNVIWEKLSI